jgi:U4/U6.U5 tri-snRNP-associated protein 2
MQAVNLASDRRYSINKQAEVLEFMAWLLNTVGRDLVIHHSIGLVTQSLQGRVQVSTKQLRPKDMTVMLDATFQSKTIPFYYLSLDLPPVPLYQSSSGEFAVPQVPLEQILSKYDGGQLSQRGDLLQAFSLEELPEYLILHYKRFVKAHLIWEKNRTIVSHPLTRLPVLDSKKDVHHYDIVANICHRGEVEKGHFFIQLLHPATGHWYEIDDLMVRQMPAVNIPLSESYLQIWRRHEN